MKLLMLRGLPGSGKSTWAKQFVAQNPGWVRVNKDSLREMMGSYRPGKDEPLVRKWRDNFILSAAAANKSVVVDDTNFAPMHEEDLRALARLLGMEFEVKFFDTPLKDCIANDLKRPSSVGEKVIRKMWSEYLAPKSTKPEFDPSLPNTLICDLDGTLCLHNGRSPYDAEKCDTDLRNDVVYKILWWWKENDCRTIHFVSGREEKFRQKTEAWLVANLPKDWKGLHLLMRPTGDKRSDDIVKQEIYDTEIRGKYNVGFVMDDRNRVVDMWRRNGLTCLQVAEGDF